MHAFVHAFLPSGDCQYLSPTEGEKSDDSLLRSKDASRAFDHLNGASNSKMNEEGQNPKSEGQK